MQSTLILEFGSRSLGLSCALGPPERPITVNSVGRGSSVGITTRYGLEGPGTYFRYDFPHLSRPALGPTLPPVQWVLGPLPEVKRPGRGADHPPRPTPNLKKEYSYTSTPPLGLRGLFYDELYHRRELLANERISVTCYFNAVNVR